MGSSWKETVGKGGTNIFIIGAVLAVLIIGLVIFFMQESFSSGEHLAPVDLHNNNTVPMKH